jgi:diguanylate cyclase (GGDEF)-like protein
MSAEGTWWQLMKPGKLPISLQAARRPAASAQAFDNALLEALPMAACFVAADGRILGFNQAWQALMGGNPLLRDFARREIRFLSVTKLSAAQGVRALGARVLSMLRRAGQGRAAGSAALTCEFAADAQRLAARVTALPDNTPGCLVVCEDVTDQRRTERDLESLQATGQIQRRSVTQYALLANFGQFVLSQPPVADLAARVVETAHEGLQTVCCQLQMHDGDGGELTQVGGQPVRPPDIQVQITGSEGIRGTLSAWLEEAGKVDDDEAAFMQNLANTVSAYMERKSAEDRLAYMAQFDALTGLPNRTLYLDRLAHAIDAAARDHNSVAVMFVDIDRFKAVNDTLGHAVGDELLVQIAARLKATVRLGDSIGRLSGDEFALVLPQLGQADHAAVVGQKITTALSTPFAIQGHTVYVSGSVGISLYPADGMQPETLLKNADMAMYRAKQSGRNAYQFYMPQLQERALARLQLENRLRDALDRDEYVLEYQPRVDLRTGEINGLEALLRWRSPDGELIAPREFIPVLEDTGLIIPVGERVLSMACMQLKRWLAAGFTPPPVAVNISARQFRQDQLDVALTRPIFASGVDPRLIEFELTESMLMGDAEGSARMLRAIKAHGIRLVLDDFGTGYSSMHYLKMFPLDALKIDREFIRDMLDDANNSRIVAAIIGLARNLDLRVVAEGVENARQLAFLRRHGCNEAQGFGIARPLSVPDVTRMFTERRRFSFIGSPMLRRQAT